MARLYSNLVDGSNRRYFFDLESAPGGLSPTTGQLVTIGYAPTVQPLVSVSRSPLVGVLNVVGHTIFGPARISPAVGQLTVTAGSPNTLRQIVVTNAIPTPDYEPPNALEPTIAFITTVTPAPATLTVTAAPVNAYPGGDIGYVSPAPGLISLVPLGHNLVFLGADPGRLNLEGLIPTVIGSMVVEPGVGQLVFDGVRPMLSRPFEWIDVDAPPPLAWTTTTGTNG